MRERISRERERDDSKKLERMSKGRERFKNFKRERERTLREMGKFKRGSENST